MKVTVFLDHRFDRTPDGAVWTKTTWAYPVWQRYLDVFDEVVAVARIRDVPTVPYEWKCSDGDKVSFIAVPYYLGPLQYILRSRRIKNTVRSAVRQADAVILRTPSRIAATAYPLLRKIGYLYGVEAVADPYDVFAPGSINHPLRPFLRRWFTSQMRQQCASACAASYVTAKALQLRYPCPNYSVGVSDVVLPDAAFNHAERQFRDKASIKLIFVGSLDQLYKAPDVLIEALGICVRAGLSLELAMVGDGRYRAKLESKVAVLGLSDQVKFLGKLPAGDPVRAQLDKADIFVLPSKTEGLPRALIEAMARGLPCIGSTVGGIPELLPLADMVPPGDADALANKIREVATDHTRMAEMSARNLAQASRYHEKVLHKQRIQFYQYVKERTEEWLSQRMR